MSDAYSLDDKKLKQLSRAWKNESMYVKVGILGGKGARVENSGKGISNAAIGAAHEYGTSKLPKRSWLRMPLANHLDKKLYAKGKFDPAELAQILKTVSLRSWFERIAILSEQVIQEAFDTAGFGQWKVSNMRGKKNQQTLVETGQLRKAVTAEVVD